jgi:ABC-type uncharacterized transport system substrate-binding protein
MCESCKRRSSTRTAPSSASGTLELRRVLHHHGHRRARPEKDGKYDRAELDDLTEVNIDGLKEFDYFTFPVLGSEAVRLGEPRDYWLEHKNGLLALHFTLPFASPVLADAPAFSFSIQDASFFIAFHLAKTENPVRLGAGAPKTRKLKIDAPDDQRDTAAAGPMARWAAS